MSNKGLLCFDLQLHIILEQDPVLAVVAYAPPRIVDFTLLPQVVEAHYVLAVPAASTHHYHSLRFV